MANLGQINQIISNNAEIHALYPEAEQGDTVEITQGIVKLHAFPAGTYTKQADGAWTSAVSAENPAVDNINVLKADFGIESVEALMMMFAKLSDVFNIPLASNIGVGTYDSLPALQQRLFVPFGSILLRADYPSYFAIVGHNVGTEGLNPTTHFRAQDLRGGVQRFLNDGATDHIDPDADTRISRYAGGLTGNVVNTFQDDGIETHTHTTPAPDSGGYSTQNFGTQSGGNYNNGTFFGQTNNGMPTGLYTNTGDNIDGTKGTRMKNTTAKGYVKARTAIEAFTPAELVNIATS